jgi:hypothetical protein
MRAREMGTIFQAITATGKFAQQARNAPPYYANLELTIVCDEVQGQAVPTLPANCLVIAGRLRALRQNSACAFLFSMIGNYFKP